MSSPNTVLLYLPPWILDYSLQWSSLRSQNQLSIFPSLLPSGMPSILPLFQLPTFLLDSNKSPPVATTNPAAALEQENWCQPAQRTELLTLQHQRTEGRARGQSPFCKDKPQQQPDTDQQQATRRCTQLLGPPHPLQRKGGKSDGSIPRATSNCSRLLNH